MKKRVYFYISVVILIVLMFAAFSCSPTLERQEKRAKRKYFKALKLYPTLIDSTSKSDTVVTVDTITIRSTHYITNTILDSILSPCDPDTVIRWKIKREIQDRCTHESLMGGKPLIFQHINGTCIVSAKGNSVSHVSRINEVHTENTVYIPNQKCEEKCEADMKEMKSLYRKQKIMNALIFFVFGFFSAIAVLVILRLVIR